jgi:hypothetical protein
MVKNLKFPVRVQPQAFADFLRYDNPARFVDSHSHALSMKHALTAGNPIGLEQITVDTSRYNKK